MSLEIFVKLEGDAAKPIIDNAAKHQIARNEAIKQIKEKTGCDDVLVSISWGHTSFHIAFKSRQESADYHKKKDIHAGLYVHSPRAKTEQARILSELSKSVNEIPRLNSIVKSEFPIFDYEEMVEGNSKTSFGIARPSFGMDGESNVVYGRLPLKDGLEIPAPWQEINAVEIAKFQKKAA